MDKVTYVACKISGSKCMAMRKQRANKNSIPLSSAIMDFVKDYQTFVKRV